MKRLNLLKVLSVVMVVAMLMLSTTSAFAAVTASQNATDTKILISGSFEGAEPYKQVRISVFSENDQTMFVGSTQVAMGMDGTFSTDDIDLGENAPFGWYVAKIQPYDADIEEEVVRFYFAPLGVKLEKLKQIVRETDPAQQKANLEECKDLLGIDTALWDKLAGYTEDDLQLNAATAIIENLADIRKNVDSLTVEKDLPKVLKEINKELYTQALNGALIADISDIGKYIDTGVFGDELASGRISDAGIKAIADSLTKKNLKNADALEALFKENVFVFGVTSPKDNNSNNSKYFIDTYGTEFGLTSMADYNKLTSNQKMNVVTAVKNAGATTLEKLNSDFTAAVKQYSGGTTPGGNTGNTGNTGNGGNTTIITPTATPTTSPNVDPSYNDIDDIVWAHEAIKELSKRKIFEGYDDGSFGPNNSILREEFIKITVVGLFGAESIDMSGVPSFTDAQSGWFAPYVAAAENKKITAGIGDGLFGTGMEITRQDMALMLYRMIKDAGLDVSTAEYNFTDKDQIADYAKEAVFALKNIGVISGYDDDSFQPEGSTTRAEAAVLLYKTLDKIGKIIR